MKNFIKKHKIISGILIFLIVVVLALFVVSHAVFHRSFVATVIEIYMVIIDREKIYAQGPAYEENLQERAVHNLEPYFKPDSVNMDISYYYTYEHDMQVYHFNEEAESDTLIIYYPGGGYLNNPLKYHWKLINKLSQETQCPVLMPVYPKVPNFTCEESYEIVMKFYLDVVKNEDIKKVVFIGDSSGGGMALVMAQLLRDNYPDVIQPSELILLSPWLDASAENEKIDEIDPDDPMLDKYGLVEIGKLWAGDLDVHNPLVSPIYGTFENLGHLTIFAGTRDVLSPEDIEFSEILTEQGIEHTFVLEEGLNHPYALFPIAEAKKARAVMVDAISGNY
jgi:acetyl esterase/lipase